MSGSPRLRRRALAAALAIGLLLGGLARTPRPAVASIQALQGPAAEKVLADPASASRPAAVVQERRDFDARPVPVSARLSTLAGLEAREVLRLDRGVPVPARPKVHRRQTRDDSDPPG